MFFSHEEAGHTAEAKQKILWIKFLHCRSRKEVGNIVWAKQTILEIKFIHMEKLKNLKGQPLELSLL